MGGKRTGAEAAAHTLVLLRHLCPSYLQAPEATLNGSAGVQDAALQPLHMSGF